MAKTGEKPDHAKAKEVIAGLVSAGATRLIETKGLNFVDKEKAKRAAEKHCYTEAGIQQ